MKKALALLLAALMLLALCACGSSKTETPKTDAPKTDAPKTDAPKTDAPKTDAPASDGKVYDLIWASTAGEGNPLYDLLQKPIMDAITEAAGGRITFTVYTNGSLAGFGEILKGCQTGICDIGGDNIGNYPGVYPYDELLSTPGLYFGADLSTKIDNLYKYSQKYTAPAFEDQGILLIGETPGVPVYLYTTKPLEKTADLASRTFATSSNYAQMVTAYGASASNMIPAEQYEAIRLNVIDSVINGAGPLSAFRLYEVLGYAYEIPFATVFNQFFMSKAAYDKLPADLQKVIDDFRFSDAYKQISMNFVNQMMANVYSAVENGNKDFVFAELPAEVSADLMKACDAQVNTGIQKLRDAGLDADGVVAMLDSFK